MERHPHLDAALCRAYIRTYEAARYGPDEIPQARDRPVTAAVTVAVTAAVTDAVTARDPTGP